MSRFNTKQKTVIPTTQTHEGGVGYVKDPKIELISLLATGLDSNFYEKENDRTLRLKTLIDSIGKKDPIFVAKALVYARVNMGQRSITHLGSVYLAPYLSGNSIGTKFFTKRSKNKNEGGVIFRVGDIMEITSAYFAKNKPKGTRANGQPSYKLPNSLKRGFKLAIEAADSYEISKYQAKTRSLSLVDMFNLVHPKPKDEKMKTVFKQLMEGTLKQFNTVEDKNSKTGQEVAAKVKSGTITKEQATKELQEAKEDNYQELIQTKKIGYIALLRNLRNILKNSSDKTLINSACELLTDQKLIKQSLVWPHQIDLALEIMLTEFSASQMAPFAKALDKAYELAIPNMSDSFPGKTAVIFDSSGSMSSQISVGDKKRGVASAIEKASLIAATFAKAVGADVFHFADRTQAIKYNPNDSINTLKKQFLSQQGKVGYRTSFNSILSTVGNKYDRYFIISDMQGSSSLNNNQNTSHIYSIDICGYASTSIKPTSKVYSLAGYSAEIYTLAQKMELDTKQILKEIEAINI